MRKRASRWLWILVAFWILALPVCAARAGACSLTLRYVQNTVGFEDLQISIYRVADISSSGKITATAPFDTYPVQFNGITSQKEWDVVADTLEAYVVADGVKPLAMRSTDQHGTVVFDGLDTGVYFVRSVVAENDSGRYLFDEFLIFLPALQEDGTYLYDVEASPKCGNFVPAEEYQVTKLWKDSGDGDARPTFITVDILLDGVVKEQVTLNAANNWTHSWRAVGENGKWTVVERNVPEGYRVTVTANGTAFLVTNVSTTPPVVPPTGDTASLGFYVILLAVSGLLLVLLSSRRGRRKDNEEK